MRIKNDHRNLGIDVLNTAPWGTHLCMFYEKKEDLINTLVPYFKEGLLNNEFCMWVVSDILNVEEVKKALNDKVNGFDAYLKNGQMEILGYKDWYVKDGKFDSGRVLKGWLDKENNALKKSFAGLRLTGDTMWLEKENWQDFVGYEEAINNTLGEHSILALCTYSLSKCGASEIVDVAANHQFTLIKSKNEWKIIQSSNHKILEEKLKANKEEFFLLIQNSLDIVIVFDKNMIVTYVSPSLEKILGYGPEDLTGRNILEFIYPEDQAGFKNNIAPRNHPDERFFECRFKSKKCGWVYLEMAANNLLNDPRINSVIVNARDISERRRLREELVKMAGKLASSNKDLEQFAYIASHDLQEPLRTVSNYAQILERRYKGKIDNEMEDLINNVTSGANRMHKLIEDLLAYSKLNSKDRRYGKVDLNLIIDKTVSDLKVLIEENGAVIRYDNLPIILCDRVQIERLFQNLIANSIKFQGKNTPVVDISAKAEGDNWIILVKDNGMGFEQKFAEQIFTIFKRLHGKEDYPGTGIGLAVCKKIVESHGGKIWAQSSPGKGASFYFTISKELNG